MQWRLLQLYGIIKYFWTELQRTKPLCIAAYVVFRYFLRLALPTYAPTFLGKTWRLVEQTRVAYINTTLSRKEKGKRRTATRDNKRCQSLSYLAQKDFIVRLSISWRSWGTAVFRANYAYTGAVSSILSPFSAMLQDNVICPGKSAWLWWALACCFRGQ